MADPVGAHATNVTGTLHMLTAARDAGVQRVVYASSCAVYGDGGTQPLREDQTGAPLSPYAATKCVNELYAYAFNRCYKLPVVGLRYFNVFGPRQDPRGPYAAVIPQWIASFLRGEQVSINGDGQTSRDFCYVANIVQANLRAALLGAPEALNRVYNVAMGERVTLNQLFFILRDRLADDHPEIKTQQPTYREFRPGDIRHSQADLTEARHRLGYEPHYRLDQGLEEALDWYRANLSS
jgi:UDP-N-acetylglucosamine 4-epimerase